MATHLYCDQRRILLIDQDPRKQNLRATVLRHHEIEVHTAHGLSEAESLWKTHSYDLVLLAAQEVSDVASMVSAQIREIKPQQRIGLLVGPPAYVRELGGVRRKAASVKKSSPIDLGQNLPVETAPSQWRQMVGKVVGDWYLDQCALLGLR